MPGAVQYNDSVRALFRSPAHAGDLQGEYDSTLHADVSEGGHGARLTMQAGIADTTIRELRFRVWGCPHLIAAAEATCAALEGHSVNALKNWKVANITQKLSVPIEKSGRILLVEDALAGLWAQCGRA